MPHSSSHRGLAKLVYLLALTALLFWVDKAVWLAMIAGAQVLLWLVSGLGMRGLRRATWRLRLFFLLILLSYAFLDTGAGNDRWLDLPAVAGFEPSVNLSGMLLALVMCLRVLALVIASAWVQHTLPAGGLVDAMRRLHVPANLAITIDASLHLLGDGARRGAGKGSGGGRGKNGAGKNGPVVSFARIRRGDLGFLRDLVRHSLHRARTYLHERYPDLPETVLRDLSVVLAVSLAIMGLKLIQVLPGVPIASGHKNLLIVPLLLFAARATHMRFGGLLAGTGVGVVSFLLGYGKYGILEIAHFATPGLLADLLMPFARARGRTGRLLQFAVIGTLLGAGRFAANLLVIVLAGAPQLAFVFFAPMLISQLVFGALSCLVSLVIVNRPDEQPLSAAAGTADGSDTVTTSGPGHRGKS